jgi:hypothetical protein
MSITIAYCSDAEESKDNGIFQYEIARHFPGSLGIYEISQRLKGSDINILSGDVCLSQISQGNMSAHNVYVMQEQAANDGAMLLKLGAKGFLLLCTESPLYARKFYQDLRVLGRSFKYHMLFGGTSTQPTEKNFALPLLYPSYHRATANFIQPWLSRKRLVMVARNKYYNPRRPYYRKIAARLKDWLYDRNIPPTKTSHQIQLLDKRLDLIEYFGETCYFDLHGDGWENLGEIPGRYSSTLTRLMEKLKPGACADKISTISGYQFALCLENCSSVGYLTEKIFDCFMAGVIPIYYGAPDVGELVNPDTFIDMRRFESFRELGDRINAFDEAEAMWMLDKARDFLDSEKGKAYSYEGFAAKVVDLVMEFQNER